VLLDCITPAGSVRMQLIVSGLGFGLMFTIVDHHLGSVTFISLYTLPLSLPVGFLFVCFVISGAM
jgi:hypothetical protein